MLTKEECERALDHFEKCYWDQDNSYSAMNGVRKDLDILNELINEHFSNPPLKFEELKEGMFVWDNKRKAKLLIGYCYSKDDMAYYNFSNPEDYKYIHLDFEENRFYRKEVQE